jgi:glycosyltransferase involved in cell wall biosynthesis
MTLSLTHLIPVFNTQPHHLLECVESIRNQDANPIMLIDDGSTSDATQGALDIIAGMDSCFIKRLPENTGTPFALNTGHSLIDTEWVAVMGSSDIALPGKYKAQIEYLQDHPETDVLGTSLTAFRDTPQRSPWFTFSHPEKPKPHTKKGHDPYFIVNHGTVVYRNEAVKKVGGYNNKYRRGQDVELWARMWQAGCTFRNLSKVYYLWRR